MGLSPYGALIYVWWSVSPPSHHSKLLSEELRVQCGVVQQVAETEGVETESAPPQNVLPKKVTANHLWNFQYTPRENVVGSSRQPRARRPRITFNKERYLQAK